MGKMPRLSGEGFLRVSDTVYHLIVPENWKKKKVNAVYFKV